MEAPSATKVCIPIGSALISSANPARAAASHAKAQSFRSEWVIGADYVRQVLRWSVVLAGVAGVVGWLITAEIAFALGLWNGAAVDITTFRELARRGADAGRPAATRGVSASPNISWSFTDMTLQLPIPRRPYAGDVNLSIIGFGAIVLMGMDQRGANRIVAEVVDKGINYFDVAPSYGGGEAEIKLGPALEPHRKKVFLACKTMSRDAKGARA